MLCQSEGILERINESPWARCLQGAVDDVVVDVVDECYCFLIYIIVGPPQPGPPHFYFAKVMFSTFSAVSLQSEQGSPG